MYEAYFGLQKRPFAASPDADCFAAVGMAEAALADLLLCVQGGRGIAILAAAAGTGKTLLCRRLALELGDEWTTVVLTHAGFPTRRSLLQAMLYELGRPYTRMGDQELRLELKTAAREVRAERQGVVVVIDEAHLLNERLLEEVRLMANTAEDGAPLFRFVLSGQLGLEETLAFPALEAFRQRIGCQTTLETLSQSDSGVYLATCAEWAGASLGDLFTPEATRLICHASDGLPRALNQLSDHGLLLGCVTNERPVTEDVVRQALDDLRQLPLHWNAPTRMPTPLEQLRAQHPAGATTTHDAEATTEVQHEPAEDAECAAFEIGASSHEPQPAAWESGEAAAFEIGGEPEPTPPSPPRVIVAAKSQLVDESICDPWSESTFARDVFEALPGDETPRIVAHPAAEDRLRPGRPVEPPHHEQTTASFEDPDHAVDASAERPAAPRIPGRPEHSRGARPRNPHFAAPPVPRKHQKPQPPRTARPQAELADEEVVFDRYAMLDAGKKLPPASSTADVPAEEPPTASVVESWESLSTNIPELRPDARIDRIMPLLDEALTFDAPTASGTAQQPSVAPAAASPHRSTDSQKPSARGPVFSVVSLDDDLEERIGQAVLESCLDAQQAITGRGPRPAQKAGSEASEEFASYETSGETPPEAPTPPSNESAPRQYSNLFSALRKKFRRGA